eukprot:CAMPEP_0170555998 /NCGR_PEP_ID=MMETSP0211-20121228/15051_1 /TAXON_ID=311385 /ORGANISM="Pseudokeronopsis sp., Strain OXSARD2" /LENGTH=30 /DNA_ID= /DNA_START= /DNA_END= /DNA_ORIENTATION=
MMRKKKGRKMVRMARKMRIKINEALLDVPS